ncbi:error-prone DNA polymerase [Humibacter sp. BT305]|nr:error-prone DNA polymerase [Humibacter sp. BT305]
MGWNNPAMPWSELESALSGRTRPPDRPAVDGVTATSKRAPYRPDPDAPPPPDEPSIPYAELHAHSTFSFLDGASSPEDLVAEAARLRLDALALTDHDGYYGVVRFAEAAEKHALRTVFGAELSLDLRAPQNGVADPHGSHVLLLARGQEGYHRLAGAITSAQLAQGAEKGKPVYSLEQVAADTRGDVMALTGCRKSPVRLAYVEEGIAGAEREVARLVDLFGHDHVLVELTDAGDPLDSIRNDDLAAIAQRMRLPVIATGNVHYATPDRARIAQALAAVRARRSLDELDGWLPAAPSAHLRSGAEMTRRFARYPGAVETTVDVAADLAFELRRAKPKLPRQEVPEGHTPMSWLTKLVHEGVAWRYPDADESVWERIRKELAVIEMKDFPGYFLIVNDIVAEARRLGILCQGRGSAANSAVCYVLGITAVDSIKFELPFERFLSSLREEEPDIDVDFDSDRREEIIQYVYAKYGRRNAAQVANVIQYRPKAAVRDMAKALGHSPGQQDAWTKQIERWGPMVESDDHDIPRDVVDLAQEVMTFPRHLGIHSGGMVLTDRPVGEVCPIENARMEDRTVLQWDKDDCAWMGLVKFDLLGLGMLSALQHTMTMVEEATGRTWDLASIPKEEQGVYDMLCRADSIGVFQVESRAQIGTLPRLQPRKFYDLVVEIALIRPGPIQGGAVHPFIRRKLGEETIDYIHPDLEPVLRRTLGVPLFQEQLMQMAIAVGGCTPEQADLLRRAMGSKRGIEKIESLKATLFEGMAEKGITGELAESIYLRIESFANFGFAESHANSFALLVYASSWFKLHYPAAFLAGLLRAQPMGFYSPQTLSADAQRHGVRILRPDIQLSGVQPGLEVLDEDGDGAVDASGARGSAPLETGRDSCLDPNPPSPSSEFDRSAPDESAAHRRDGRFAVRLGLAEVSSIGVKLAERIVAERDASGPYRSMADLAHRVGLTAPQLEALATAGAFESFGLSKRQAVWEAGNAAQNRPEFLPGTVVSVQPPLLPFLTDEEQVIYDLWATGISPGDHPIRHSREALAARGAVLIGDLETIESGRRIEVGGVVTHRQRPATASGITFLNLEDETGLLNVVCSVGVWKRYRRLAREAPAMVVRGILERSPEGVVNLVADAFSPLPVTAPHRSRDFR